MGSEGQRKGSGVRGVRQGARGEGVLPFLKSKNGTAS